MRKKITFNEIIGKTTYGEYIALDYVFDDSLHDAPFRGATGSHFHPVTNGAAEEARNPENAKEQLKEFWQMSVKDGRTEESLEAWVEHYLNEAGDEALWDLSYSSMGEAAAEIYNKEQAEEWGRELTEDEKAEFSECTGGGRCFSYKMEWAKVYRKDLLALALSFEKPEPKRDKGWREQLSKWFTPAEIREIRSGKLREKAMANAKPLPEGVF